MSFLCHFLYLYTVSILSIPVSICQYTWNCRGGTQLFHMYICAWEITTLNKSKDWLHQVRATWEHGNVGTWEHVAQWLGHRSSRPRGRGFEPRPGQQIGRTIRLVLDAVSQTITANFCQDFVENFVYTQEPNYDSITFDIDKKPIDFLFSRAII